MFGHLPELLVVLLLGLLVFGPKRMVEMGSALGKAWSEFRDATKDMSWSNLLTSSNDHEESPSAKARLSQLSQNILAEREQSATADQPAAGGTPSSVVESSIESTQSAEPTHVEPRQSQPTHVEP